MKLKAPTKDYIYIPLILALLMYFGITFGLTFPSPFPWLDKIFKFISDALLAFLTAYPFWWLMEFFRNKSEKHRVATLQWNFIVEASKEMNDTLAILCDGLDRKDEAVRFSLPDYLERFDHLTFTQFFTRGFHDRYSAKWVDMQQHMEILAFDFSVSIKVIERHLDVLEQYTSQFEGEYTGHLRALRGALIFYSQIIKDTKNDKIDVYWYNHFVLIRRILKEMSKLHQNAAYAR